MAWQVYKTLKYDAQSITKARWCFEGKGSAWRPSELSYLINNDEEIQLFNQYKLGSQPYSLIWLVKRPGGSVYDRHHAIKFYDPTAAMLWKLSRHAPIV